MKKLRLKPSVTIVAAAGLTVACLLPASVMAKAQGQCALCHTMHNSQDNAVMTVNAGPNETLLRDTCVGCHSGTNDGTNTIPYVMDLTSPPTTTSLAGGNFYWVEAGTDNTGHNVVELVGDDVAIGVEPPGWNTGFSLNGAIADGTWTGKQLTCAGTLGCHGTHGTGVSPFEAINGSHHADDATIDGSTVPTSYRFLGGITGGEDGDWEYETVTDHNVYQGEIRAADTATDGSTISYLCAECHGNFHAGAGDLGVRPDDTMSNPWIRHPTDIQLLTTGEYAAYDPTTTGGGYSPLAPVAWTVTTALGVDTRANAVVMCLSCHRAHGSPNADLLRWDYATCDAGTDDALCGCFVCHTTKDAG